MAKNATRAGKTFLKLASVLTFLFVVLPRIMAQAALRWGERNGYTMKQFKFTTRDGTRLSAVLYIPLAPPEKPQGYPAIIMVHSWALSRWQNHLYAPYFAKDGYVILSYDCRGWGSSGGRVECAGPEHELNDLEDALDWLLAQQDAPVNPERIGLTGISYGGGHSLLMAARDKRIRTIVPMHGWTDLKYSLAPNGSLKYPWGLALLLTASWATRCDPRNRLYRWTIPLLFDLKGREKALEEMAERSVIRDVDQVECPVFIVGSWHDDLFEPNQMLDFYEKLSGPKKLYIGYCPHGMDAGMGPRLWSREIWSMTMDWFDYWLKDRTDLPILEQPRFHSRQPWKRVAVSFEDWPPPRAQVESLCLHAGSNGDMGALKDAGPGESSASRPIVNNYLSRATSGPPFVRPQSFGIPVPGPRKDREGDFLSYLASPVEKDLEIVGVPRVTLNVRPDRASCQVNAFLYDVGERGLPRLITYGTCTELDLAAGETNRMTFDLLACDWLLRQGHRVRLTLSASNLLFVRPLFERFRFEVIQDPDVPSLLELPGIVRTS
jgi:predicted acyl esterase